MQTAAGSETLHAIPIGQITPDPDQPRKTFEQAALQELANSIRENGLLQAVTVRPDGARFIIIAGERRFRAHQLIDAPTVLCRVIEPPSISDVRIKQIIENDQRQDVAPLEQARSYQSLMDATGWSVEELAEKLGKAPHRITERTSLLKLQSEYQQLLACKQITPSQAFEMSRLSARGQDALFKAVKSGLCENYNNLRIASCALVDAEAQFSLIADERPHASESDKRAADSFERRLEQVAAMLRSGIKDNEVEAVKKVDPNRARHAADLIVAMQSDLRRLETALRQVAVQAMLV